MQVQKISFTSAEQKEQKESALYSKRGYMQQVRTSQFFGGFLATYGILESIDKFILVNKTNVAKETLKKTAKKHTKYNLLFGLAAGIGSILIGKFFTDKYTIPFAERQWDKLVKYEEINNKAKDLIKQAKEEGTEQAKVQSSVEEPKSIENKEKKAEKSDSEEKISKNETSKEKTEEKAKEKIEEKDSKKDA